MRIDGERFVVKTESDGTNTVVGELNSLDEYGYCPEHPVRHNDVVVAFAPNGVGKEDNVIVLSAHAARSLMWALLGFYARKTAAYVDVPLVEGFLDHLEHDRHASIRTRNYRLAALHAFFRYVQSEVPDHLLQCQRIIAIPLRRHPRTMVGYLAKNDLARILVQPDVRTRDGRRDAVSSARVVRLTGARRSRLASATAQRPGLDGRLRGPG